VNKVQSWLLFLYKVPHEPSSYRVYVWRKLKRIGALLLHDSAWALPMSSRSLAQFQELAAEIAKLGGDSLLWEARLAVGIQDEALVRALLAQLEPAIDEVPAKVE
jgi:Protein ChrB, N-terminal